MNTIVLQTHFDPERIEYQGETIFAGETAFNLIRKGERKFAAEGFPFSNSRFIDGKPEPQPQPGETQ